VTALM